MAERQMKTRKEHITYVSLADVVKKAEALIKEYPHLTLDSFEISTEEEWGSCYATLKYKTVETDNELKKRLEWQENIQKSRRLQYEALKKEFEK